MDPEGRNDRPRRAAASMPTSSASKVQRQFQSRARPVTTKTATATTTTATTRKKKSKRSSTKKNDQGWWDIRDIVDERLENGVLQYRVAWKGIDPGTGQPYEPSWEPSENVTEAAVKAWEERKREKTNASPQDTNAPCPAQHDSTPRQSEEDSQPVQEANWRRRRRRRPSERKDTSEQGLRGGGTAEEAAPKRQKRVDPYSRLAGAQEDTEEGSDAASDPSIQEPATEDRGGGKELGQQGAQIVVELPHTPAFERSEFERLSSSQTSHLPSQQSQQSQQSQLGLVQAQTTLGRTFAHNRDQRVIPDSQELSALFTSETQNSSLLVDSSGRSRISQVAAPIRSFGEQSTRTIIPSHQPDHQADRVLNNQDLSITTEAETTSGASSSQQSLAFRFPSRKPSQNTTQNRDDLGFLTQVPLESNLVAPASQLSINDSVGVPSTTERNFTLDASISTTLNSTFASTSSATDPESSHTNSQAAQIVPQVDNSSENFTINSQATFALDSEEVTDPNTITTSPQPQHQSDPQSPSHALGGLDGNTRSSSSAPRVGELVPRTEIDPPSQLHATQGKSQDCIRAPTSSAGQNSSPTSAHQSDPSFHITPNLSRPVSRSRLSESYSPGSTNMESTPSFPPGMSTLEKLRMIRQQHFPSTGTGAVSRSSNAPTESGTPQPVTEQTESHAPAEPNAHVDTVPGLSVIVPQPGLPMMPVERPVEPVQEEQPMVLDPPQTSHERQQSDSLPLPMAPAAMTYDASHEEPPATLDPSNLTLSIEERDLSPSIPTDDALAESAGPEDFIPPVDFSRQSDDELPQQYSRSLLPYIETGVNEHLITLPFFATTSGREQYNNIIRENEAAMTAYNSCFLVSPYRKPAPPVVATIDRMFLRLFDFCDFPPFLDTVLEQSPDVITKHVVGTNSKFCFVDEFLVHLNELGSPKKILILARPGQLLDLLSNVVQTRGYHLIRSGQDIANPLAAGSPLTVAIHSTSEDSSSFPTDADAVIAFDYTYRQGLLPTFDEANPPLVLLLTNTDSIQHINMRVSENMEPLERKNYLMLTLVKAMRHVEEPDITIRKPPEIARMFAEYLDMPDNDDFYWDPQELPDDIFENLHETSSQIQQSQHSFEALGIPQMPGSRKRSHDELEESASKRPKMSQALVVSNVSHVSDSVMNLLGPDIVNSSDAETIAVPIEKLEEISAKITRLRAEMAERKAREREFRDLSDRSKKEVDSYVFSINRIQIKFMEALKDRGIFEAECTEAKDQAKALTSALESARKENATLKETNAELRKKLTEATESLLHSSVPELSKIAQLEKDLEEGRSKTQHLEKRLSLAQGDLEYTKLVYQQASQSAAQLRAENRELEARADALAQRADDNIARANRFQNQQEIAELTRMLGEQRGIVRDREAELNRLREELRLLRNGRRDTRQSSVPRSPRLSALNAGSVLSPRAHQTTPSARGAASSSRAGSPVSASAVQPPMGVFETPLFGRHSHLRD